MQTCCIRLRSFRFNVTVIIRVRTVIPHKILNILNNALKSVKKDFKIKKLTKKQIQNNISYFHSIIHETNICNINDANHIKISVLVITILIIGT